jgi:uncharacterized protein HemY
MRDVDRAEPLYRQLLDRWSERPDGEGHVAVMYRCLGTCALFRGDSETAESLLRQAIPYFKHSGQSTREAEAWRYLADCLAAQGKLEEAAIAKAQGSQLIPLGYIA